MPIVTSGLIGYWNAQQGLAGTAWQNLAPGTSGKYNGALVGSPVITAGQYATLNGTSQYVSVPTIQAADKGTSWEAEIYLYSAFDGTGGEGASSGLVYMPISAATSDVSKLDVVALKADGSGVALSSDTLVTYALAKNALIKINFSVNVTTGQETLYINDTLVRQETNTTPSNLDIFRFGGAAWGGYYFKGRIYSTKLYNRSLTSAERTQNTGIGTAVGLPTNTDATITAVVASATAQAIVPTITAISPNVSISAVVASANASALAPSLPNSSGPSSLTVVAHFDDDLGGVNTDIYHDMLNAGTSGKVYVVYLTAGDAGEGWATYAQSRQSGVQAAYAYMAGLPNSWTTGTMTFGTKTVAYAKLNGRELYHLYVRLPDNLGAYDNTGSNPTIYKLWYGTIPSMSTVDTGQTYTKNELTGLLANIISSQTFDNYRHIYHKFNEGTFEDLEHYDHYGAGYFANAGAIAATAKPKNLYAYRADSLHLVPAGQYETLSQSDYQMKNDALATYLAYDTKFDGDINSTDIQTDMHRVWRYAYTVQSNVLISSIVASANASGIVPTISAQRQVTIQGIAANANASGLNPIITAIRNAIVNAIVATSSASALPPIVGSFTHVVITAVTPDAISSGIPPVITTIRSPIIQAKAANATASGVAPKLIVVVLVPFTKDFPVILTTLTDAEYSLGVETNLNIVLLVSTEFNIDMKV